MSLESVGEKFDLKLFDHARTQAWNIIEDLSYLAKAGMKKEDFEKELEAKGISKWWHPTKIRLGTNTQCSFRDKDLEEVLLKEGDLFFFDIGPVFDGHEADVGQTFCLGNPAFINPAETLFQKLREAWDRDQLSGEKLYNLALEESKKMGLLLNRKMAGHRLGDFPHALFHKGPLAAVEKQPVPNRWILEVHLVDEEKECGYFFEDLL